MEITRHKTNEGVELLIKGRLDGYWADHLAAGIGDLIREGCHKIRLNLSQVTYLSSAGIRVLVDAYKQLRGIDGAFAVSSPSNQVKKVLDLAGLGVLLTATAETPQAPSAQPALSKTLERGGVVYEASLPTPGESMQCRVVGSPELLDGCRFRREHAVRIRCGPRSLAVGIGAFGDDYDDCESRFGEFLAVAGAAAYLPSDGTGVPDYMLEAGDYVAEPTVLCALVCEGGFSHHVAFEAGRDCSGVGLSELVSVCLELTAQDRIGMAVIAESGGLVGAALRRSPALESAPGAPFSHPEIREWLSFTPERVFARSVAILAGVAARSSGDALAPMLRPLGAHGGVMGHFHAGAFSYRPLKKGQVLLEQTVKTFFEHEALQGVLHLLHDDRQNAAGAESRFLRGACWIAPLASITADRRSPP